MTKLPQCPKNPVCKTGTGPRDLGETRLQRNGCLQYKNPMTGKWEAAVRLDDIRGKILHEEDPSQYTFPKKHGNTGGKNPTNYTSFLLKDKDVGPLRANRPDILFRITKDDQYSAEPAKYLLDEGRVVLDAFDHGIRDFPHLPRVLSSELEGHDIEYYYRQNAQLTDYDLIARMPSHWGGKGDKEWKEPRGGTINQRAQRYRGKTGLISWNQREGTKSKNAYILGLIPNWCKNPAVNSIKNFRDLEKDERIAVTQQNKGKMLSRARTAKRESKKDAKGSSKKHKPAEETSDEDEVEEYHEGRDLGEDDLHEYLDDEEASRTNDVEEGPRRSAGATEYNSGRSFEDEYEAQAIEEASLDAAGIDGSVQACLHSRPDHNIGKTSRNEDFEVFTTRRKTAAKKAVPGSRLAVKTVLTRSHEEGSLPGQSSNTYGKHYLSQVDDDPAENSHVRRSKRARNTVGGSIPSRTHLTHTHKSPEYMSRMELYADLESNDCKLLAIGNVEDEVSTPITEPLARRKYPSYANKRYKQDVTDDDDDNDKSEQGNLSDWTRVDEVLLSAQPTTGSAQGIQTTRARDRTNKPTKAYDTFGVVSSTALNLDPEQDSGFQAESQAALERGDFRYAVPITDVDKEAIHEALELTRLHFYNLKGSTPPQELNEYRDESYASQFRRLQQHHTKKWMGRLPARLLYNLPAWYRGFHRWRPTGTVGRALNRQVRKAKASHVRLMKEIDGVKL